MSVVAVHPATTAVRTTVAARRSATAKLAALGVLAVPTLISLDVVTGSVLVAAELIVLPLLGLRPATLLRAWPVLISLLGIWVATTVSGGGPRDLVPVAVRVLALALPGLLFVVSTDPVDLADGLVQRWHAPARFAYGALAAFRLVPLLAAELQTMRRARRARGLGGGGPVGWARSGVALLFGLLVQAVRRGVRLAAAMDARGFGAAPHRTFARPATTGPADRALVLGAVVVAVGAVVVSIASGHWHPVLG